MRRTLLPLLLVPALHGCIDKPDGGRRETVRRSTRAVTPRAETRQCLAQLSLTQAKYTPVEDRYYSGGCHTVGTVRLESLRTDSARVALANLGPVTCTIANQFAGWARFGVDRAAQQILGARVARIETFGSYSCRTVAGTRRLSGHATANAIDIAGFVLEDGRRVTVLEDWDGGTPAERRFLRVVHASACKRFGTTLGPQYNAAHRNHLHLEADGADFCR